jgi:hypothetical protein
MIDTLLSRLDKVRGGNGRWMAQCPAHEDRDPSLSVSEVDDRILLHCHAGCEVYDVLNAIGLEVGDLFAEPLADHVKQVRAADRYSAIDLLRLLDRESLIVVLVAEAMARGEPLDDDGRARLWTARERIAQTVNLTRGTPA